MGINPDPTKVWIVLGMATNGPGCPAVVPSHSDAAVVPWHCSTYSPPSLAPGWPGPLSKDSPSSCPRGRWELELSQSSRAFKVAAQTGEPFISLLLLWQQSHILLLLFSVLMRTGLQQEPQSGCPSSGQNAVLSGGGVGGTWWAEQGGSAGTWWAEQGADKWEPSRCAFQSSEMNEEQWEVLSVDEKI